VVSSGSDSIVDPHEIGVLGKLGDDVSCASPSSLRVMQETLGQESSQRSARPSVTHHVFNYLA
jgi:hypothetical protein